MTTLAEWWTRGAILDLDAHRISTHVQGDGPTLVFLHGFPTSSHDWAEVIADLSRDFRCVTFDYLGYGASDKPSDADYSSMVQTHRALAILEKLGVRSATVVGHDLGGILLQQLLQLSANKSSRLTVDHAVFINSSVYADLYRPTPAQLALADPLHGPAIAAQLSRSTLEASLAPLFPGHPLSEARADELWEAITLQDGQLLWPQQLIYMAERTAHGAAWEDALHATSARLSFIYGLADPISGAQVLGRVATDLPKASRVGLPGLGHFPQVEAAFDVVRALRSVLGTT